MALTMPGYRTENRDYHKDRVIFMQWPSPCLGTVHNLARSYLRLSQNWYKLPPCLILRHKSRSSQCWVVFWYCLWKHALYLLGSIVRVGYSTSNPDFYLVLHGLHCQKRTWFFNNCGLILTWQRASVPGRTACRSGRVEVLPGCDSAASNASWDRFLHHEVATQSPLPPASSHTPPRRRASLDNKRHREINKRHREINKHQHHHIRRQEG